MKQLLLILVLLTIKSVGHCQAMLDVNEIALSKPGKQSARVHLGESPAQCMRALGQPDGISDYYSEIDEDTINLFRYDRNTVAFLDNKLVGWDLLDHQISVEHANGQIFKVGDKAALQPRSADMPDSGRSDYRFLGFACTHKAGISQNMYYDAAIIIGLKKGSTQLDSRLQLLFNSDHTLFCISLLD